MNHDAAVLIQNTNGHRPKVRGFWYSYAAHRVARAPLMCPFNKLALDYSGTQTPLNMFWMQVEDRIYPPRRCINDIKFVLMLNSSFGVIIKLGSIDGNWYWMAQILIYSVIVSRSNCYDPWYPGQSEKCNHGSINQAVVESWTLVENWSHESCYLGGYIFICCFNLLQPGWNRRNITCDISNTCFENNPFCVCCHWGFTAACP